MVFAEEEQRGDLGVGAAGRDKPKYLDLARGEPAGVRGGDQCGGFAFGRGGTEFGEAAPRGCQFG
jgi:hypothetical protein